MPALPSFSRSASEPPVYDSTLRPHPMVEEAIELVRYRDLLRRWTVRNITLRYKRSVLGIFWTLLEPLMMMAILTVVFQKIFRFPVPAYPVYVLSGLVLFDFHNRSTVQMIEESIASQNLAQQIYLPRSVFAVAASASYLVHWAIALIPLTIFMVLLDLELSWALLSLAPAMLLTAAFSTGCGLVVATIGAHFHDVKLFYTVVLQAWFYATPIIYPDEVIPPRALSFFQLNPLYHLLQLVRLPVMEARVADGGTWLLATAVSFATLFLGWWLFCRSRDALAYAT